MQSHLSIVNATFTSLKDTFRTAICHVDNFIVNLLGAITAYCMFPKKPCINVQRTLDTQLSPF